MILDTATPANVKTTMTDAGAKSADLWMVPVAELNIDPDFNVRVHDDDYEAHIEYLTTRMLASGFDRTKPLSVYTVTAPDGKPAVYITDGHSRHAAVKRANSRGADISRVPCVTQPAGTSAEDLVTALVTSNTGKSLKPIEIAAVCKRLQGFGLEASEIAGRLCFTEAYVKQLFELLAAPKAVRDMVSRGEVAATLAVQMVRKAGKDAAKVLKEGLSKSGKGRVTAKHVREPAGRKTPVDSLKPVGGAAVPVTPYADIIRELIEYVETVRVGDDAQDLLDRAHAAIGAKSAVEDL